MKHFLLILMVAVTFSAQATITTPFTGPVCAGTTGTFTDDHTGGTWSCSLPSRLPIDATTGVATGLASGAPMVYYTYPVTTVDSTLTGYCVNTVYYTDSLVVNTLAPVPLIRYLGVGQTAISIPVTTPYITLTTTGIYVTWNVDTAHWTVITVNPVSIKLAPRIAGTTVVTATVIATGCSVSMSVSKTP